MFVTVVPVPRASVLTYGRIADGPLDARSRLGWLDRQQSFTRHPYRQLAKVLREGGDDHGWRRVGEEMERKTWAERSWVFSPASWLLRGTIGYGYFSIRALWWLLFLVITGWFIYGRGYAAGNIVPTDKDVYDLFVPKQKLPGFYEPFHALPYSLENSFPMVKFGLQDKWTPRLDVQTTDQHIGSLAKLSSTIASSNFLRVFRRVQICVGWILATLFVGGVTGIIRTD